MQTKNDFGPFDLSITIDHPELVEWLQEIPGNQLKEKVEGTLVAGHFILNLVQASAGEEQMSRFFRPVAEKMDDLRKMLDTILGSAKSSYELGKTGEIIVAEQLTKTFPADRFEVISKEEHGADIKATFNIGGIEEWGTALIEVKLYTDDVPSKELNKFRSDLQTQMVRYGLMVSLSSRLTGVAGPLQIEETDDFTAIYVSNSGLDGVNLISATAMLKAIMLYHARAETAQRISAFAIEQTWRQLSEQLDNLRAIAGEVQGFRDRIRSAKENLDKQMDDLLDAARIASIQLQYAVERLTKQLAEELHALPATEEQLALPEPTEPNVVLGVLNELEMANDKRGKAFRGLYELAQQLRLQIIVDEADNSKWIFCHNDKKIAQTGGTQTRFTVIIPLSDTNKPVNILPSLESIKKEGVVIDGKNTDSMLRRVKEHLLVQISDTEKPKEKANITA